MKSVSEIKQSKTITISILVSLFLLALGLRFLYQYTTGWEQYLTWVNYHYNGGIVNMYVASSRLFLEGQKYISLSYPPGYAIFLAMLQFLGIHSVQAMRFVQVFISSLMVFPLFFIARFIKLQLPWASLVCFFYAICPFFIVVSAHILAEWVSPVVIILTLFLLIKSAQSTNKKKYLLLCLNGLLIGAASMFRPDLILLIFVVFFWILLHKKNYFSTILTCAAVFLCFFIVIFPWGYHNKVTHNAWVFTSTSGGNTLWEGLGELNNNYGYACNDAIAGNLVRSHGLHWQTIDANKFFMARYFKAWKEHPFYVLKVIGSRWIKMILPNQLLQYTQLKHQKVYVALLAVMILLLSFLSLVYCLVRFRCELTKLFILFFPLGYAMVSVGLVHYEARYCVYLFLTFFMTGCLMLQEVTEFFYLKLLKSKAPTQPIQQSK